MGQGELNLSLSKLHSVRPLEVFGGHGGGTDDLNGARAGAVTAGHLVVELGDGAGELEVAVLAVHVVGAGAGVVAEPDAVVLDGAGVLLGELYAVEDLAGGLLHFAELAHEVPEFGLGHRGVGGEDDHAVGFGVGVLVGAGLAAHYLVLAHFSGDSHCCVFVWIFCGLVCSIALMNEGVAAEIM